MHDFDPPTRVTLSRPMPSSDKGRLVFAYTAGEIKSTDLGIARVELLIDGNLVAYKNRDLTSPGFFSVGLASLAPGDHSVHVAAWDNAFNCTLSEVRSIKIP